MRPSRRPSFRFRRRKSIRTAVWRRISRSRPRARARCTRSRPGPPGSSLRRRARSCRGSPRRRAWPTSACRSRRATRSRRRSSASGSRWRASCRRTRSTSTASSASAAASSTSIRPPKRSPSGSSSSATSSSRSAGTTRPLSDRSRPSIASSSARSASCWRRRARRSRSSRSATIVDYARAAGGHRRRVRTRRRRGSGRKLEEQWRTSAQRHAGARPDRAALRDACRQLGRAGRVARWRQQISQLAIERDTPSQVHVSCVPTLEYHGRIGDWVDEIRNGARARRSRRVRGGDTPGRAERMIELLADYDVRARAIGRRPTTCECRRAGHDRPALARVSSARRRSCCVFAETDLFEEERRVHERRRSATRSFMSDFRDLKIGDLVVHVDNGIGRFVGLKSWLGRRPGQPPSRSSWSSATPATTSSSSRSSGSISCRSTRAARRRRSTSSAAPPGRRPRPASRRPCATWPRSCSSSTPRARPSPGHAFSPDSHWQQEFDDAFEYDLTPDQQTAIDDITRDMESADADGPAALRRRRLRQDRGRDARGVQGGDRRQAGRGSRADDRAGVPALPHVPRAHSPAFPFASR